MSDTVIRAEGLGKEYIISHEAPEQYTALRDVIHRRAIRLFGKRRRPAKEQFWALKDINFEINRGEAIGIIGRNGAGKSTLLKILSRITEPTTGRVEINGRTSSLLEIGTGFHPELTGRENIFLNGAVLGMTRSEIKKKFGAIVDFSGVEKFLDTPVKRFSTGMYLRLAFAVAAHLEPEILMVDEVLAVGDAEFQKKCLGKMDEVSRGEGRTVLFVSHNMNAILQLCEKAIWLDAGTMKAMGDAEEVVRAYLSATINDISGSKDISLRTSDRFGTGQQISKDRDPEQIQRPCKLFLYRRRAGDFF
jgi:lipopolysaccharide transport system ATP-binding protein